MLGNELGHGAYSVVYRALWNGTPCAVKLPRTPGRWTRSVYREAVSLARVRHPALPRVLGVGEIGELVWIAMELVEGETLADRIAKRPLDGDELFDVVTRLVDALAAVHAVRLVHRDVKPRNVIVQPSGAIRLIDFGFAIPLDKAPSDVAGTLGYAAPEQLRMPARVDHRADLYAVGRIILECQEANDASFRDPLAKIAQRLVAPNPDDRYASARALALELSNVEAGGSVLGPKAYANTREVRPLVGREGERRRLATAWSKVDLHRAGSVVMLRGTRGSGKSHLLEASVSDARRDGSVVLTARCREGDAPLATLRSIFERMAATDAMRSLHEVANGDLAKLVTIVAPQLERSPEETHGFRTTSDAFAEAVAELLVRLARRLQRMMLVIDDAQWIDHPSRDVLARFAARMAEAPALLVLATRDAPSAADAITSALPDTRVTDIELSSFRERQVEALIASHLADSTFDKQLTSRITRLGDGTPLGTLEVLGAFLDVGAVRPEGGGWVFEPSLIERVDLPRGALALLGRRVRELPPATLHVLEYAAILGSAFDDNLLASVVGVSAEDLAYALDDARRTGLLEPTERGQHAFVHDSLREMLLARLSEAVVREHHQHVAETMEALPLDTIDAICVRAHHYERGIEDRGSEQRLRAALAAAAAVLERFDNERALQFFEVARKTAQRCGKTLDHRFFAQLGEAQHRVGALDESLESFDEALRLARTPLERASALGRIAWVHQMRSDAERAWNALGLAFAELGASMPVESVGSALRTMATVTTRALKRSLRSERGRPLVEKELLSELHIQNSRLGVEHFKPARFVQSALAIGRFASELGPSRAGVRARAWNGVLLAVLGRHDASRAELESAQTTAVAIADPIARAFCVQLEAVATAWSGRADESLRRIGNCLRVHGHWLELNDYCQLALTADALEVLRGRATDSWSRISLAVERLRRSERKTSDFAVFVFHRARAAMIALSRTVERDPWLETHFALTREPPTGLYHRLVTWAPRVRCLVEAGEVGDELERLVEAFESEGHNPRFSHPLLAEYYVAIVHARIHQCIRASTNERAALLPKLRSAVSDLRAATRMPLLKVHRLVGDAHVAWFENDLKQARARLLQVSDLAEQEECVWGLYSVARARAHMLREAGKENAARDHARVAVALATSSGAEHRARFIREEFALQAKPQTTRVAPPSTKASASQRARKQLTSFLNIVGSPQPGLDAVDQATTILDNLLADVGADLAVLSIRPNSSQGLVLGRARNGESWSELDERHRAVLEAVTKGTVPEEGTTNEKRKLAVPLFLYDERVGALYLERAIDEPPFSLDDRLLFELLSHQIPIALEIARLLGERTRLEASLQHSKKMEALGELAGGVAHDFNNMLMIVRGALEVIAGAEGVSREVASELEVISQAADGAARLTRQLLGFSKHQPASLEPVDATEVISKLEPMLRRIAGKKVALEIRLEPAYRVQIDRAAFEQALVNLTMNARDAMPDGGALTISARELSVDEVSARATMTNPGDYVVIEVTDTGVGMDAEVASRVFDPFFTTKRTSGGTGLGLTMVYGFAKNSGGNVSVASDLGAGTTFRIFLPRAAPKAEISRPSLERRKYARDDHAILVVDDDRSVRESLRRVLHRAGYRVFAAGGATDALDIVRRCAAEISLVVLDVMMPGMTGPELARRFAEIEFAAPILFISGYAPNDIPVEVGNVTAETLLQKPFGGAELLARVAALTEGP